MTSGAYHSLELRELSLWVRLGCSSQERALLQEVRVGLQLRFPQPPQGAVTDQLRDTVCYAELSEAFRRFCQEREFALVEKLAGDLMTTAREKVGAQVALAVSVHKVAPPVEGLRGGVVYRVGDFP